MLTNSLRRATRRTGGGARRPGARGGTGLLAAPGARAWFSITGGYCEPDCVFAEGGGGALLKGGL
jgi:hypothetical protein